MHCKPRTALSRRPTPLRRSRLPRKAPRSRGPLCRIIACIVVPFVGSPPRQRVREAPAGSAHRGSVLGSRMDGTPTRDHRDQPLGRADATSVAPSATPATRPAHDRGLQILASLEEPSSPRARLPPLPVRLPRLPAGLARVLSRTCGGSRAALRGWHRSCGGKCRHGTPARRHSRRLGRRMRLSGVALPVVGARPSPAAGSAATASERSWLSFPSVRLPPNIGVSRFRSSSEGSRWRAGFVARPFRKARDSMVLGLAKDTGPAAAGRPGGRHFGRGSFVRQVSPSRGDRPHAGGTS